MKQRITFLTPQGDGIDPKDITVDNTTVRYAASDQAVVESRITFSLDELPDELTSVLEDSHELHIRWTRETAYVHLSPILSRLPAGLHVTFTPRHSEKEVQLCPALRRLFSQDIKCQDVLATFSRPPVLSERFSSAASYQYYTVLPNLRPLAKYVRNLCLADQMVDTYNACLRYALALTRVSSFDVDYDAISHAVTLTALLRLDDMPPEDGIDVRHVRQLNPDSRVEVGILSPEKADEPEELKLGGYLTVIGENEKPGATIFSFPSRHHPLPENTSTTFEAAFTQPIGLHPDLNLRFPATSLTPPNPSCALHAYLTMPSVLFVDRYQLSDPNLLTSSNIKTLHALSGAEDLEAPEWAVSQWGSASLFELAHPSEGIQSDTWTARIPLHLRYVKASQNSSSSYQTLQMPWPVVFWACEAEEGLKMATNPFDRVNLCYDSLFGPKTLFYQIPPDGDNLMLDMKMPVLEPHHTSWLEAATLVVVMLGFVWVIGSAIWPVRDKQKQREKAD